MLGNNKDLTIMLLDFTVQKIEAHHLEDFATIPLLQAEANQSNLKFLKNFKLYDPDKIPELNAEKISHESVFEPATVINFIQENINYLFKHYRDYNINLIFLSNYALVAKDENENEKAQKISAWNKVIMAILAYLRKTPFSLPNGMTFNVMALEHDVMPTHPVMALEDDVTPIHLVTASAPISPISGGAIGVMMGAEAAFITLSLISGALTMGFAPLVVLGVLAVCILGGGLIGSGATKSRWIQNLGYLTRGAGAVSKMSPSLEANPAEANPASNKSMTLASKVAIAATVGAVIGFLTAAVVLGVFTAGIGPLILGIVIGGSLLAGAAAGGGIVAGIHKTITSMKGEEKPSQPEADDCNLRFNPFFPSDEPDNSAPDSAVLIPKPIPTNKSSLSRRHNNSAQPKSILSEVPYSPPATPFLARCHEDPLGISAKCEREREREHEHKL